MECDEGVAVGCGWQAFVAYVNVGCYYVVGIPFGCLIGFKFDLGVKVIKPLFLYSSCCEVNSNSSDCNFFPYNIYRFCF